ncbi:MAG: rhodanese-like domain-containing protein [Pseudomonadota bacterium]|uniref:rhodanese-like domain-containing protein n=1 Tax=Polaromonas sp. TaxID=1869339 RepID=UPI0017964214|nr:rhodanese-like domain-containing protein [Polaromonas sp.]MBA3592793.1 sulfurtransferase [Polaromonas sp.]MDQ3271728.1 rhodanese-like domain-containing protein [Pseudomonadota bacterium]
MIAQLTPADFNAWRDSPGAGTPAPVVLDVREPWEIQTASVCEDGFTLLCIPMRDVPTRVEQLKGKLGADQPIACLCHHGMRSLQVANFLAQNGFTAVVNLQGGIDAWSRQRDAAVPHY